MKKISSSNIDDGSNREVTDEGDGRVSTRHKTRLSGNSAEHEPEGSADLGTGPALSNRADTQTKYSAAISLVLKSGSTVTQAAREVGVNAGHLSRKLNALGARGDPATQADAGDRRIFEISQTMSTLAGERLLERLENEGDRMKTTELTKLYKSSTDLVALKQQWSQGTWKSTGESGISALARILLQADVTITKREAEREALEVQSVAVHSK